MDEHMSITADQFTDPLAYHGEGPVWHPCWPGLRFVDMLAGDIVCLDADGQQIERMHLGSVAAAFRPRRGGGTVAAVERGFILIDPDGAVQYLPELWDDVGIRMNEGGCDPHGRFYCGSMAYDLAVPSGSLYRLDPDGTAHVVVSNVTCSNGLGWSPSGETAYYIDSLTYRIDNFDYDPARGLLNRRPFVAVPRDYGLPDGLAVDREGGIWVAFFGGGAVRRYRPDSTIDEVIHLPVTQVTACTFGGPDLRDLFITTSRQGIDGDSQPAAGSIYTAQPGTTGLPTTPYAG
jgi:sugar lactone lactonase YvrE